MLSQRFLCVHHLSGPGSEVTEAGMITKRQTPFLGQTFFLNDANITVDTFDVIFLFRVAVLSRSFSRYVPQSLNKAHFYIVNNFTIHIKSFFMTVKVS